MDEKTGFVTCGLLRLALPGVGSSIIAQATGLITIFFVASFNDQYMLGSVGLGSMAQNVFGFSLGRGLNSALDTLVSQSNGAEDHQSSSVHLRRAQIVSLVVSVPCIFGLLFAERFFLLVGINPRSAHDAGNYVLGTLPSMPFCFLYNATRSFLRAVKLPNPDFYVSVITAFVHPFWCLIWLRILSWGAFGAGLTVSCSYVVSFALLTGYVAVVRPGPCRQAWHCLPWPCCACSREPLDPITANRTGGFRKYLAVALPSAILIWSEWWVYEIMSLLAGLCGTEALAAHTSICNLLLILYMVPSALGGATSSMVGNAIGMGDVHTAKIAIAVALKIIAILFVFIASFVLILRQPIAHMFSQRDDVVATVKDLCLILAPFLILDAAQTVLENALRGLGLQDKASRAKLVSMILGRLLGAYILAIRLSVGVEGIWWAGVAGMSITLVLYFRILCSVNLQSIVDEVHQQHHLQIRGSDTYQP